MVGSFAAMMNFIGMLPVCSYNVLTPLASYAKGSVTGFANSHTPDIGAAFEANAGREGNAVHDELILFCDSCLFRQSSPREGGHG